MTGNDADEPAARLARWTSTDAAIGLAAENEQLRARLAEREMEIADLRARLANLANRAAQLETDNAGQHRVRALTFVRRAAGAVYRRARSAAGRLRR